MVSSKGNGVTDRVVEGTKSRFQPVISRCARVCVLHALYFLKLFLLDSRPIEVANYYPYVVHAAGL